MKKGEDVQEARESTRKHSRLKMDQPSLQGSVPITPVGSACSNFRGISHRGRGAGRSGGKRGKPGYRTLRCLSQHPRRGGLRSRTPEFLSPEEGQPYVHCPTTALHAREGPRLRPTPPHRPPPDSSLQPCGAPSLRPYCGPSRQAPPAHHSFPPPQPPLRPRVSPHLPPRLPCPGLTPSLRQGSAQT